MKTTTNSTVVIKKALGKAVNLKRYSFTQEGPGTGMQKAKQSTTEVKSKGRPQTSVINAHDRNSNQLQQS